MTRKLFINECPELIKEWDFDKNTNIDINKIAPYSATRVWWKCEFGHSYEMIIKNKVAKSLHCPFCSNQRVLKGYNDLLSQYPDIAKDWDYEKNIIKPDEVTAHSHKKVYWTCSQKHSYYKSILYKVRHPNCQICKLEENKLFCLHPDLYNEWDFTKNDVDPNTIKAHSHYKVWWICPEGHSYQTTVKIRTLQGSNCPFCSNQRVLKGYNDFLSQYPDIAKEWDYEKNIIKPDEITSGSHIMVYWICSRHKEHKWKTDIRSRTQHNYTGCPYCNTARHTSFGEQSIYYYLKDKAINRYKYLGKEIDIYLPNENIGIEFNGLYWHKNRKQQDIKKETFFNSNKIKMFYIFESDNNKIENDKIYFNCKYNYLNNLEWSIKELFKLLSINIDVNIKRDRKLINEMYK